MKLSRRVYVLPDAEVRPSPVVGNPYPASSPLPTGVDRENVRRFMKLKLATREEQ
jgi:hypothetical protein